jgi:GT2 family glycosyltransferase
MLVDAIILTNSTTFKDVRSTKRTIYTLRDSETKYNFNIILVESSINNENEYVGLVDNYIKPCESFNYNRFINHALNYLQGEWVIISNNDVGYEKGWFSEMMKIHNERKDIESFSPKDPMLYMKYFESHFINSKDTYFESYEVTEAIMGWCIVIKKKALEQIIPFDETFDMYYQDNDYAKTIQSYGIKHAIVRHSIATHLNTLSINEYNEQKINKMQLDKLKFEKKWK